MGKRKIVELDPTDARLLSILMQDARISYAEIGKKLFISQATVHARIKKLFESGVLRNIRADIDYHLLGYDICAFLGIYLEKSNLYESVKTELLKIPEVIDAHYTTGTYSIFAKVLCRDTEHLREVLSKKLQNIKGIQRTETFISLEESIARPLMLADV
ncbi:MAG: Lrp/AsnC ligand binding domain-containing protein [Saprospiraceae bacterium]|jgi:Lrp/AsnC family transcriptional regulator for asnA, asnC and gidA|nr:Lrp/AsnC ligand binding domain-containing protein [Saprospiraceae bacterium]